MNLKEIYLSVLKVNQRTTGDLMYTLPSSSVYPCQWLWDSCFHAIIYTKFEEFDRAKDEIRSLLAGQWENGMVPHMIYWQREARHICNWGTDKKTSSITQPPMIAYAVERIFEATGDKNFVKEVFDKLDNYYKWLHRERSFNDLLFVIHPWETGEDDFVAWDDVYGLKEQMPSKDVLKKIKLEILRQYVQTGLNPKTFVEKDVFSIKCLLFNTVYLKNLRSMLHLAEEIGSKETKHYNATLSKTIVSFEKELLDQKTGLYSSAYNHGKEQLADSSETSSVFLPLFAGIPTKQNAEKLVKEHLLDEDRFWTRYPVPTVATDHSSFQPDRYWRGSTWININWFIYKGLIDYGFDDTAKELKEKSFDLVERSGFCEYFNPIDGTGYGPKDFCWSGLIFDM